MTGIHLKVQVQFHWYNVDSGEYVHVAFAFHQHAHFAMFPGVWLHCVTVFLQESTDHLMQPLSCLLHWRLRPRCHQSRLMNHHSCAAARYHGPCAQESASDGYRRSVLSHNDRSPPQSFQDLVHTIYCHDEQYVPHAVPDRLVSTVHQCDVEQQDVVEHWCQPPFFVLNLEEHEQHHYLLI